MSAPSKTAKGDGMNLKKWFKAVVFSRPLRLISIVFFALSLIIAVYGVVEYLSHKREMDEISENVQKKIVLVIKRTVMNIQEIMENVNEIYTIDPLLMAQFNELSLRDGIESQILLPPPTENLPDYLHTTPEKVKYWLEERGGKDSLSKENYKS